MSRNDSEPYTRHKAAPAKNGLVAGAGGVVVAAGIKTLPAKAKIVKECH